MDQHIERLAGSGQAHVDQHADPFIAGTRQLFQAA